MENATAVCGFITDGVLIGTVRICEVQMPNVGDTIYVYRVMQFRRGKWHSRLVQDRPVLVNFLRQQKANPQDIKIYVEKKSATPFDTKNMGYVRFEKKCDAEAKLREITNEKT